MLGGLAPTFDDRFRGELRELFRWRRDVRRFRPAALAPGALEAALADASLAPSVGYSQPWRFVLVEDPVRRAAVADDFERCNAAALADYDGDRRGSYAALKLAGLREAPVHLAAFVDEGGPAGHGLGRRTAPETLAYSVVGAIAFFWLACRARGIGVGWVSILDHVAVTRALDVSPSWSLIAYLCVGYPTDEDVVPELARRAWQEPISEATTLFRR
ncbi:MAG: 5,6-dimethylbenzimidazole synthase [Candidatus Eremiobacteraeota bacterium]|nr:5,6-dimethylbenzimidazole synthase [Candidatus Eremiobacteraeota bacterium]